ncbi:MAG: glycosyltransferase [Epsilonproteobacteria bacterium]|nr:glycosyltransferase [Campylobacterota bacterium]
MKILHISPDMHTGGAQKFCIDICNELAKNRDLEVVICSVEKLNDAQQIMYQKINPNVKFISLDKEGKSPFIMLKIAKMIFDVKPDITHTHTRAQMFAALGLILFGKPNVHTIHSVAHKETTKGRLKFYKFLYDFFKFTPISISDQVLKSTQALYGDKYDVKIDNGTQKLKKTVEYDKTKVFIDSLKKDNNTKIFVSIGRFYPVKNQELLIEGFEKLLEEGIDAHLIILGSLDVVPVHAQKCQALINSEDRIHLLGEKANVSDYLIESHALCFSSTYEGLPMAIIEAMSVGIPTVSTPVGGIPDVVIDGKTGYLSKDMSIESYKEALKRSIEEKQIEKESLIKHFEEHYTIEKCANAYLKLYEEKIDGNR